MTIITISSREFNRDVGQAKKSAHNGPVFISDRGRPAHVLLTIEEYREITGQQQGIVALLAMPAEQDIEFEVPRVAGDLYRPADLS